MPELDPMSSQRLLRGPIREYFIDGWMSSWRRWPKAQVCSRSNRKQMNFHVKKVVFERMERRKGGIKHSMMAIFALNEVFKARSAVSTRPGSATRCGRSVDSLCIYLLARQFE